jgi:hypothetical protein
MDLQGIFPLAPRLNLHSTEISVYVYAMLADAAVGAGHQNAATGEIKEFLNMALFGCKILGGRVKRFRTLMISLSCLLRQPPKTSMPTSA